MQNKVDITSTAIEKGIDLAKDFLDKLIMPTVEETGLLIKDKVTLFRLKNQIKTINKTKDLCDKHSISPKTISLKLLCPLLENASLEEDELLQDKWAILLSNLVDSEQNIQNHVFPYILGQISANEYLFLEKVLKEKSIEEDNYQKELEKFLEEKPSKKKGILEKIENLDEKTVELKQDERKNFDELMDIYSAKRKLQSELSSLKYGEMIIRSKIAKPAVIPEDVLEEYEVSNLTRLGLIKLTQETIANPQTLEIPRRNDDPYNDYLSVDLEVELESNIQHIVTELGKLFVNACTEKHKKQHPTTAHRQ